MGVRSGCRRRPSRSRLVRRNRIQAGTVARAGPPSAKLLLADDVESAARLEPLDLLGAERVEPLEVDGGAVGLVDGAAHGHVGGQVAQAVHADAVVFADLVEDGSVGEGERQEPLLLQVGLVDAGEAAGEDHLAVAEAGLHRGVLPRAALAHVLVADGDPADAFLVEVLGDVGVRAGLAVEGVLPEAGLTRLGVDGAEVEVAGDVLEVTSRSEEHTSELQSLMRITYAVFFLKNKKNHITK